MTGHSGPERESRSCDCTACDADRMQKLSVPGVLQAETDVRGVCAAVCSTATHTAVLRKAILRHNSAARESAQYRSIETAAPAPTQMGSLRPGRLKLGR